MPDFYSMYCMTLEDEGICKIGYTSKRPDDKLKMLGGEYEHSFTLAWIIPVCRSSSVATKLEGWWKHEIERDKKPVEGEEIFRATPDELYEQLVEAASVGQFPVTINRELEAV
jgi:hypothetical protein